jgi:hypothetical protein
MEGMMFGLNNLDSLFVGWAFFLQMALIIHFAMRKRFFERYTLKYGWVIYALCIPAVIISIIQLLGGQAWYYWLGGFLFLIFAIYGYYIDYIKQIAWRKPLVTRIMIPYVALYLAPIMFYWWPLIKIMPVLWAVYACLYVLSTLLNITTH